MTSLETELERARELEIAPLATAIESIGFECTRCGACCRGHGDDEHTATVFPEEVRELQQASSSAAAFGAESATESTYDWRDVARPMPYGLSKSEDGNLEGETFEWALQTTGCGDCVFYEEDEEHPTERTGRCTVHEDRPLICQTYPFSIALSGTSQPMGDPVDEAGIVRAHECEGLGRDISRDEAEALARTLKERAIRELEEALAVLEAYEPVHSDAGTVVVHDSEGAKRPDGTALEDDH